MPNLWEASLTLGYPVRLGPTTVTLQGYLYNVFNNQIPTDQDMVWSNQRPEGIGARSSIPNQTQSNENYGKATSLVARLFRLATRVSSDARDLGLPLRVPRAGDDSFRHRCRFRGRQTAGTIQGWISDPLERRCRESRSKRRARAFLRTERRSRQRMELTDCRRSLPAGTSCGSVGPASRASRSP